MLLLFFLWKRKKLQFLVIRELGTQAHRHTAVSRHWLRRQGGDRSLDARLESDVQIATDCNGLISPNEFVDWYVFWWLLVNLLDDWCDFGWVGFILTLWWYRWFSMIDIFHISLVMFIYFPFARRVRLQWSHHGPRLKLILPHRLSHIILLYHPRFRTARCSWNLNAGATKARIDQPIIENLMSQKVQFILHTTVSKPRKIPMSSLKVPLHFTTPLRATRMTCIFPMRGSLGQGKLETWKSQGQDW